VKSPITKTTPKQIISQAHSRERSPIPSTNPILTARNLVSQSISVRPGTTLNKQRATRFKPFNNDSHDFKFLNVSLDIKGN